MRTMLALAMLLGLVLTSAAFAAPGEWQPGPEAVLDDTYSGHIDVPMEGATLALDQPLAIAGWVVDRAADGWAGVDAVHVYDGEAGPAGTFLGQAEIAQSRPDVAEALGNDFWTDSGFVLSLGGGKLGAGQHTLSVYAHTPDKGWWFTQVSVAVAPPPPPTTAQAPPVNVVLSPSGTTLPRGQDRVAIKGYALDPVAATGVGIDHVDVYLDEVRGRSDAKFIGTADLGHAQPEAADAYGIRFMLAGYQIDLRLSNLDPGNHHIYSYATSSITGQETLDVAGFNIAASQ
jgi:hypothetical protein